MKVRRPHSPAAIYLAVLIGTAASSNPASAQGSQGASALPPGVAAVYAGEPVLADDVLREMKALAAPDTAEGRRVALNSLLLRRMMMTRVRAIRLDETPDGQAAARRSSEMALLQLFERTLPAALEPTDAEVEAFMAGRPAQFASRRVYVVRQLAATPTDRDPARFAQVRDFASLRKMLEDEGSNYEETVATFDSSTSDPRFLAQLAQLQGKDIYITPTAAALVFGETVAVHEVPFSGELARTFARNILRLQKNRAVREEELKAVFASEAGKVVYADAFRPSPAAPR